MPETKEIEIIVIKGADGTVNVRTEQNIENGFVDEQFQEITEGLGTVAMADVELPELVAETDSDVVNQHNDNMKRIFSGHPERPSKLKK